MAMLKVVILIYVIFYDGVNSLKMGAETTRYMIGMTHTFTTVA